MSGDVVAARRVQAGLPLVTFKKPSTLVGEFHSGLRVQLRSDFFNATIVISQNFR